MTAEELESRYRTLIRSTNLSFLDALNEVLEYFYAEARWPDLLEETQLTLDDASNTVSLNPRHSAIVGVSVDGGPRVLHDIGLEYLAGGNGHISNETNLGRFLIDMGDNFATDIDPPSAGVVRVKSNAADGGFLRVFGKDSNGDFIYNSGGDGEEVDLSGTSVDTTNSFASITDISKPPTGYVVEVYHFDGVSTETLLVKLLPDERAPRRHRYKMAEQFSATDTPVIRALVKKRFIPLTSMKSVVRPSNSRAIRCGLMAIEAEMNSDNERAQQYWNMAVRILSKETGTRRENARPAFGFNPWGQDIDKVR